MGKKAPTEVFLVYMESNRGGGHLDAVFTSREAAVEHVRNRTAGHKSLYFHFNIDASPLLTHAPTFRDVYVIRHSFESLNHAAMTEPRSEWIRLFDHDDRGTAQPWAKKPLGYQPQVLVEDTEIVVWGRDDAECWRRFETAAEEHGIPYFGPNGVVNRPEGF